MSQNALVPYMSGFVNARTSEKKLDYHRKFQTANVWYNDIQAFLVQLHVRQRRIWSIIYSSNSRTSKIENATVADATAVKTVN